MAYGQGIAVTPIQLIAAVSAFGNEGKLMQPRLVKELKDNSGKVLEEFKPKVVRQVVSKQTADEMDMIMEATGGEGTGAKAKISVLLIVLPGCIFCSGRRGFYRGGSISKGR